MGLRLDEFRGLVHSGVGFRLERFRDELGLTGFLLLPVVRHIGGLFSTVRIRLRRTAKIADERTCNFILLLACQYLLGSAGIDLPRALDNLKHLATAARLPN